MNSPWLHQNESVYLTLESSKYFLPCRHAKQKNYTYLFTIIMTNLPGLNPVWILLFPVIDKFDLAMPFLNTRLLIKKGLYYKVIYMGILLFLWPSQ